MSNTYPLYPSATATTAIRLSAAETNLAPGVYDLDSSAAAFALTLADTVGVWEFHNTNKSFATNSVTISSPGTQTFTDETGAQVDTDLIFDVAAKAVTILHTELGDTYRVSIEASSSGNIYDTDGTLTGNRTVTLAGNELIIREGVQDAVTISADGLDSTQLNYIPKIHTFATGVNLTPTNAFQFYYPIANVTSAGNCAIDSFSGANINSTVMFALQNVDVVSRAFVFDAPYKGFDASTNMGTITLAANTRRFVRFRANQGGAAWTLVEDSAGLPLQTNSGSAILFNSSAGVDAKTLPSATGSGAILFYANDSVQLNSATLGPFAGQQINDLSINTVFNASNYSDGTQFIATDVAPGKWVVAVAGNSVSETLARYSVRGVAANITVANGANILPIGSLVTSDLISSGQSNASEYDPLGWRSANQITVSKTGLYRIAVNVVHSENNLSGTSNQDAVGVSRSGIRINATSIEWIGIDDTAGLGDQMSGFMDRQFTAGDDIDVVVNATSAGANEDFYVSFSMEELPTTETILAGHVPVEDLDYVSYASSSIGGNIATELVGSYRLPLLDDTSWSHKVDTNSLLTLAAPPVGDGFTIKKAGLYAVSVEMVANSYAEQTVYIFRNGIIVAAGWANTGAGTSAMSQVGADITISLAVGDRIQFGSLIAAGWNASLSIRQLATKTVTYLDPAFTEAKDLHRVSLHSPNNYTPTTTPSIGGAAVAVVDLDNATVTQVYNPNGMIDTATNTINIQQVGAYSILFSGNDTTVENNPCIILNGVRIGQTYTGNSPSAGEHDFTIELIKDLVIGDRLEFGFISTPDNVPNTLGGCSIVVTQLPNQEYVTPGDVPVQTLNKFEARKNATQSVPNGVNTDVAFGTLTAFTGSGYNSATGVFTAPAEGWYSFDAAVRIDYEFAAVGTEMFITINVNGTEKARGGFAFVGTNASVGSYWYANTGVSVPLAIGDQVKIQCRQNSGISLTLNGAGTLNYFTGVQTSTYSVIRSEDIPVNDQGASGYFDIGSIRYQWGIIPTSSGSFALHNLPAPFANANYSISGNNIGDFNTIGFSGRTTTTFTYISVANTGGGGSGAVSFIAIGLKP